MRAVNLGIIGCGNFPKAIHIPNIKKNPKLKIHAVMDVNESAAVDVAKDVSAKYWTTDLEKLLSDTELDAVLITTWHNLHAEQTIKAANAGKHILCEKPMGMNRKECRAIAEAVKKNNVKYTVGYNRGLAPLVTQARDLLKGLPGKKLIYHRIQCSIPLDHWLLDPKIGGGRFVGEGCHIFDLMCELVDSPPVSVYASGGIFLDPHFVKIPDSGIVTITFADGSVGTTLIASAGCDKFPKESTEIYCDSNAIHIQDFKAMDYYGWSDEPVNITLDAVDKGWITEIDQFADAILNDTESPNGLVRAARAAVISYMVNESIADGAPVAISESDYIF